MLQKWAKEVQAETILHPTPSVNVGRSSAFVACCAEVSGTPMHPVPPSSIPPGIIDTTLCSDHPTSAVNVGGSCASVASYAEVSSTLWTPSPPFPFHLEWFLRHLVVITQHLIPGVLVQKKSWQMCGKHSMIAMAHFAHPCVRSRHCLVTMGAATTCHDSKFAAATI